MYISSKEFNELKARCEAAEAMNEALIKKFAPSDSSNDKVWDEVAKTEAQIENAIQRQKLDLQYQSFGITP